MISNMIDDIHFCRVGRKEVINVKNLFRKEIEVIIHSDKVPLFTRWNVFLNNCADMYSHGSDITSVNKIVSDYARKTWDIDRYQTFDFQSYLEDYYICDDLLAEGNYTEEDLKSIEEDFNRIPVELAEAIINSKCSGFEFDW